MYDTFGKCEDIDKYLTTDEMEYRVTFGTDWFDATVEQERYGLRHRDYETCEEWFICEYQDIRHIYTVLENRLDVSVLDKRY